MNLLENQKKEEERINIGKSLEKVFQKRESQNDHRYKMFHFISNQKYKVISIICKLKKI